MAVMAELQGIVTDWSDAEIRGLKTAVGKKHGRETIKRLQSALAAIMSTCPLRKYCHHKKEAEKRRSFCKLPQKFRFLTVR